MALVGGIGSGKTTELRLMLKRLNRHADAINIYLDLAEVTDLNGLNPGAILIAIGIQLHRRLEESDKQRPDIKVAYQKLQELARGKTFWVEYEEQYDEGDGRELIAVHKPGLLKPRFPSMHRNVLEVQNLVFEIAKPLLDAEAQITVLIDGLDRLIRPERFREFAEQDLRALRTTKISVVVVTPLLLWFDKSRFLQEYFADVKHIPAAISDPKKSDFLDQVLVRRGAAELMEEKEICEMARFSGGALRDLITLARTSAEAAYREDKDRIAFTHVRSAIRQLGKRYLVGMGRSQRNRIQRLSENEEFSVEDPIARALWQPTVYPKNAYRLSFPDCTSRSTAMAATGLPIEAAWKSVSGVTGGPPILVTPKPRAHSILPSWITAILTPGTCSAAIRSAMLATEAGSPLTSTGDWIMPS